MIVDFPIYNNYKKLMTYRNIYILFHFYILPINYLHNSQTIMKNLSQVLHQFLKLQYEVEIASTLLHYIHKVNLVLLFYIIFMLCKNFKKYIYIYIQNRIVSYLLNVWFYFITI